jgi:uncharacterized repeat protein (TIGR02543 family)
MKNSNLKKTAATLLQKLVETRRAASLLFIIAMLGIASTKVQAAPTINVISTGGYGITISITLTQSRTYQIYCAESSAALTQQLAAGNYADDYAYFQSSGTHNYTVDRYRPTGATGAPGYTSAVALHNNTTYWIAVRENGTSNIVSATTTADTQAPTVQYPTVLANPINNTIPISFNVATDDSELSGLLLRYRVSVGLTSTASTYTTSYTDIPTGLYSYTITSRNNGASTVPLLANTLYYIRVWVIDQAGNYTSYTEKTATTGGVTAPTVVTGTVTAITQTSATVSGSVTGDGGAPITQRYIQYWKKEGGDGQHNATATGTDGSFSATLTGLTPGTTYEARACASNGVYTNSGATIEFTTTAASTAPTVPNKTITVGTPTATGIPISWTAATATGDGTALSQLLYRIYCSPSLAELNAQIALGNSVGAIWGSAGTTNANITTYTNSVAAPVALNPSTTYYFNVVVENYDAELKTQYTAASATTPAPSGTINSVTVSPATATLARGGVKAFTASVAVTGTVPNTKTWSVNSTAGSTLSEPDAFGVVRLTISATESSPTLIVTATSTYDPTKFGTAIVTVTDPVPATYYTVTFNSNGGSAVSPQSVTSGGLVTKPADPVKDGFEFAGWYKADGVTLWNFSTDVVTANMALLAHWTATSGIDDVQANSLSIYPNPARDIVTISGIQAGETVTITDLQGRTVGNYELRMTKQRSAVANYDGNTATINVSALTQGVYLLHAGNRTSKLIIKN